jgi:acetyl-CoA C-acetyltransferase
VNNTPVIINYAATPVGRLMSKPGEAIEQFEQDILADLVIDSVNNAGIDKKDIGSLILTSPTPATRQLGFATFLASRLGLQCQGQISEVNNMGITGGLAFDQACNDVSNGKANFALALGIEYSTSASIVDMMDRGIRVVGDVDFQSPFGLTPIAWYAFDADRYMFETGATREGLAYIAVKNREHATLNPLAQYRSPISIEDVISQRPIVEPLGLYEVSPRSDGAICLLVTTEEIACSLNKPYVRVRGRGFQHDGYHQIDDRPHDMIAFPAATQASNKALGEANLILSDIDVAELYAPCTITEILVTEAIGIAEKGTGHAIARDGETSLGGRIPVSTSGGCLSRGHPPGLTALYGLAELYEQLLGKAGERQVKDAQFGMHICEGGNYNLALAHILEAMQ